MTTTTSTPTRVSTRLRTGLALSVLLGLINIPFVFMPTKSGDEGPPYIVLLLSAVLGVVSIVAAVITWRTGSRVAIRVNAAALIINAVTTLPAFFVNVAVGIQVFAAVAVLLTVLAVVLMLSRDRTNAPVLD